MKVKHYKRDGIKIYECQDVELLNGGFLLFTKSGTGYKRERFIKMGDYDMLEYLDE